MSHLGFLLLFVGSQRVLCILSAAIGFLCVLSAALCKPDGSLTEAGLYWLQSGFKKPPCKVHSLSAGKNKQPRKRTTADKKRFAAVRATVRAQTCRPPHDPKQRLRPAEHSATCVAAVLPKAAHPKPNATCTRDDAARKAFHETGG